MSHTILDSSCESQKVNSILLLLLFCYISIWLKFQSNGSHNKMQTDMWRFVQVRRTTMTIQFLIASHTHTHNDPTSTQTLSECGKSLHTLHTHTRVLKWEPADVLNGSFIRCRMNFGSECGK